MRGSTLGGYSTALLSPQLCSAPSPRHGKFFGSRSLSEAQKGGVRTSPGLQRSHRRSANNDRADGTRRERHEFAGHMRVSCGPSRSDPSEGSSKSHTDKIRGIQTAPCFVVRARRLNSRIKEHTHTQSPSHLQPSDIFLYIEGQRPFGLQTSLPHV